MILNVYSNDISSLPLRIVDNSVVYNKSGIYIKIVLSATLGQVELNIIEAKIAGLSLFGIVRHKANSMIMELLGKYSFLHVSKYKGNILIEIDCLKIVDVGIVDDIIKIEVDFIEI